MNDLATVLAAGLGAAAAFGADGLSGGIAFAPGSTFLTTAPRSDAFRLSFGMLPTQQLRDGTRIIATPIEERFDRTTGPKTLTCEPAWP